MISGFKIEQLFKIVRESLKYDYKKRTEGNPTKLASRLSEEEKNFYNRTLDIPIGDFESEVNNFAADLLRGTLPLARTEVDKTSFKPRNKRI